MGRPRPQNRLNTRRSRWLRHVARSTALIPGITCAPGHTAADCLSAKSFAPRSERLPHLGMCGKPADRSADARNAHRARRTAENPVCAVQGRRGRRTWQRRRAATRGQTRPARRGLRSSVLSAVGRDSAGGTRVSFRAPIAASSMVPRVISPVLLGLGGLLHAVALGADGAPQEESYVHDRTATAFPRNSPSS
jgi:hypothetical protein